MQDIYPCHELEPEPLKQIIDQNDPLENAKALALAVRWNKQNAIITLLNTKNIDFFTILSAINRSLLDCLVEVNNPEVNTIIQPFCPAAVLALWAKKITAAARLNVNGDLVGKTPLHLAAIAGNLVAIDNAIHNQVAINGRDRFARTALFYAVAKGSTNLVKKLISQHAAPDLHGINDKSPLQIAIEAKNEAIASLLIAANANVNYFAPGTEPPLHMAITQGLSATALSLIRRGAATNQPDKDGAYPLHLATLTKLPEVVTALLECGANADACLANNLTALHFAASENLAEIATILIANKATIDCLDINRRNPLHHAADANATRVMRVMVNANTNISACDAFGDTALHIACEKGNFEAAQYLVEIGGNLDLLGRRNLTPRKLAEESGKAALIKLFNPTPQVPSLLVHSAIASQPKPAASVIDKTQSPHQSAQDKRNGEQCVIL